MGNLACIQ
jgi:hypothetical protein